MILPFVLGFGICSCINSASYSSLANCLFDKGIGVVAEIFSRA